jgi:potassium voltage-gated channel Eag-related subfamily H protein 7
MEDNSENDQGFKKQRSLIKRKSTKTNTKISMMANNNNRDNSIVEMTQTNTVQEPILDLDRMHLFMIYFPMNNYDVILKKYSKLQKYFGKKRLFADFSPYSFSFQAIKLGAKLRRALEKKDLPVQPNKFYEELMSILSKG